MPERNEDGKLTIFFMDDDIQIILFIDMRDHYPAPEGLIVRNRDNTGRTVYPWANIKKYTITYNTPKDTDNSGLKEIDCKCSVCLPPEPNLRSV